MPISDFSSVGKFSRFDNGQLTPSLRSRANLYNIGKVREVGQTTRVSAGLI
jgi:hypothetical protein